MRLIFFTKPWSTPPRAPHVPHLHQTGLPSSSSSSPPPSPPLFTPLPHASHLKQTLWTACMTFQLCGWHNLLLFFFFFKRRLQQFTGLLKLSSRSRGGPPPPASPPTDNPLDPSSNLHAGAPTGETAHLSELRATNNNKSPNSTFLHRLSTRGGGGGGGGRGGRI